MACRYAYPSVRRVGLQRLHNPQILFSRSFITSPMQPFLCPNANAAHRHAPPPLHSAPMPRPADGVTPPLAFWAWGRVLRTSAFAIRRKRETLFVQSPSAGNVHPKLGNGTLHPQAQATPAHTFSAVHPYKKRPPYSFRNGRPQCWGIRTRTRKNRTRICCVANYTIPQTFKSLHQHPCCLRVQR